MSSNKIGIDARVLMDKNYSGVSEFTFNLVTGLFQLERQADFVLYYNSAKDISRVKPNFYQNNVSEVKTNYPNKIFNYLMQKTLKIPKLDKITNTNVFFMPHINFANLSSETFKVITVHDLSFLKTKKSKRYPQYFSTRKNIWHFMIDVCRLLKKFDLITTVSENTKRDIMDLCQVPEEKIKVIYPGLEKDYFYMQNKEDRELKKIKKKYNLPDKFILYLGTIEPRKNISGLIEAYDLICRKDPGFRHELILVGAKGWKNEKIISTWEKSPNKNKIRFIGYVPKEEKKYFYNLASVFVYPSFYEGFGFPPLEAMACGTPVITSFTSSLPEVVGKAALTIDPYNINDIAFNIISLEKDRFLRKELIKKGFENSEKFNWNKTALNYLEILKKQA